MSQKDQLLGRFQTIATLLNLVIPHTAAFFLDVPKPPVPTTRQRTLLRDLDAAALVAVREYDVLAMCMSMDRLGEPSPEVRVSPEIVDEMDSEESYPVGSIPALCNPRNRNTDEEIVCHPPGGVDYLSSSFAATMEPGRSLNAHLALIVGYLRAIATGKGEDVRRISWNFAVFVVASSCAKMHRRFRSGYTWAGYEHFTGLSPADLRVNDITKEYLLQDEDRRKLRLSLLALFEADKPKEGDKLKQRFSTWVTEDLQKPAYSKALCGEFHALLCYILHLYNDTLADLKKKSKAAAKEHPLGLYNTVFYAGSVLELLSRFEGTAAHFRTIPVPQPTVAQPTGTQPTGTQPTDNDGDRDDMESEVDPAATGKHPYLEWLKLSVSHIPAISRLRLRARKSPAFKEISIILRANANPTTAAPQEWKTVIRSIVKDPTRADEFIERLSDLVGDVFKLKGTIHCEAALAAILASQSSNEHNHDHIVGVSKRSCPVCATLLLTLGENGPPFFYRQAHSTITGCALPRGLPIEVLRRMVHKVEEWLKNALLHWIPHPRHGSPNSLTASSGASNKASQDSDDLVDLTFDVGASSTVFPQNRSLAD